MSKTWTCSLVLVLVLASCSSEPERMIEDGFRMWRSGQYLDAVEQFQSFSLRFPDAKFAPKALYLAAGGYATQLHDFPRAVSAYLALARKFPNHDLAPEAYRKVADLYRQKLNDPKKAVMFYATVTDRYHGSPQGPESQFLIGESYFEMGQYDQARVEYLQVVKEYPESRFVPLAYYQVGSSHYAERHCADASKYYQRILADFPDHSLAADAGAAKASCEGKPVRTAILGRSGEAEKTE